MEGKASGLLCRFSDRLVQRAVCAVCLSAAFTVNHQAGLFACGGSSLMPLEFRGAASMDPPRRGVRFAGYPMSSRHSLMVICEVSTEALRLLGEMPDADGDELMGVFEVYRETILAIASRKFDKGDLRPRITDKDIESRMV
jgi:hypothetical protein